MYKIIGIIIGFLLFNWVGLLLGLFIGSSIDRARDYGLGGISPLGNAARKTIFLETAFLLMGRLAKVDGHISKDEINHVEAFIKKLNMTSEHRKEAIEQFKRGSAENFDIDSALNTFMASCGNTLSLKQTLLMYLIVIALADGKLDKAELALLGTISSRLGYSPAQFKQMLDMMMNQSHFSGNHTPNRPASTSTLDNAYKALGVTAQNSDSEIKRAYRKLMSQYHPDKLIGQGLPDDMVAVATEKAQEIQVAYDVIKQHRS